MIDASDYLPLSYLNQYAYCPRRFWLMFVQGEMAVNAPMQDGIYRHERADTRGTETDERGRRTRSVKIWSDSLRVVGLADFIEERDGLLLPLEHKRGRMGQHISDHVQLCAQAICLEERGAPRITYGEIFYWANRRRERVQLDASLRAQTQATADAAHALLAQGRMPQPIDHPTKCRDCSLKPICLPDETRQLLQEEQTA